MYHRSFVILLVVMNVGSGCLECSLLFHFAEHISGGHRLSIGLSNVMFCTLFIFADMSSTAFIEPLPVIEFVAQLLCRDISVRPLSDSDRVKVRFITCLSVVHREFGFRLSYRTYSTSADKKSPTRYKG
jgi:hypothetical protein